MSTNKFFYVKQYNNVLIDLEVEPQKATIEFTKKEGYTTYKIKYMENNFFDLMKSLQYIYFDDQNYPKDVVFWKEWFYPFRDDLLTCRMQGKI